MLLHPDSMLFLKKEGKKSPKDTVLKEITRAPEDTEYPRAV